MRSSSGAVELAAHWPGKSLELAAHWPGKSFVDMPLGQRNQGP
jgi:hypothetical protein